jgi:hypothetical protein
MNIGITNIKINIGTEIYKKVCKLISQSSVLVIEIGVIAKLKNRTSKNLIKKTINEKTIEKTIKDKGNIKIKGKYSPCKGKLKLQGTIDIAKFRKNNVPPT